MCRSKCSADKYDCLSVHNACCVFVLTVLCLQCSTVLCHLDVHAQMLLSINLIHFLFVMVELSYILFFITAIVTT